MTTCAHAARQHLKAAGAQPSAPQSEGHFTPLLGVCTGPSLRETHLQCTHLSPGLPGTCHEGTETTHTPEDVHCRVTQHNGKANQMTPRG